MSNNIVHLRSLLITFSIEVEDISRPTMQIAALSLPLGNYPFMGLEMAKYKKPWFFSMGS